MEIKVDIERLKQIKIFVGAPMYGGNCTGMFCKSTNDLSTLCAANGINVRFYYLFNESLIQRARNYITDEFMRSDCDYLLFIDSDIGFTAKDVITMIALHMTEPEKYNVVTGPYPKKTIAWEKVAQAATQNKHENNPFDLDNYTSDFVFNPVKKQTSFRLDEPVEVGEAGTGFMLIPRATLEAYRDAYPELLYKPDHVRTENFDGSNEITAYFDCVIDPVSKRYLSEDYFFCQKAREAGLKVWMCPWMKLNHIGSYVFKGDMPALASLGVSATANESSKKHGYPKKQLTSKKKSVKINK